MKNKNFEHLGWYVEYMIGSTYMGSVLLDEPDREEIGYYGRQDYIADTDIILPNKKVINKGERYFTRLYPLCGRAIKKFEAI
jgi:hypothetical protein